MAQVRVPESGQPLLRYMRQDRNACKDAFFPSYAQMIMFAASLGLSMGEFDDDVAFVSGAPYPIPIEVFKSSDLYDYALVLTLSRHRTADSLKDADVVTRTLEGYSSAGFRQLAKWDVGHDLLGSIVHEVKKLRGEG